MTLAPDWIAVDGRHERIEPSMPVEAEIKTGDRRVIEYLPSPVMLAAQEVWGER